MGRNNKSREGIMSEEQKLTNDETAPEMNEQAKAIIGEIQSEMLDVIGDLELADVWLHEGWDGSLEPVTHVMPTLQTSIAGVKEAVERVLELTYKCGL